MSDIGFDAITAANEIYANPPDFIRRIGIPIKFVLPMVNGDDLRNFVFSSKQYLLWPYDTKANPNLSGEAKNFLKPWKEFLSIRSQFHRTQLEAGLEWFEFREYHRKGNNPPTIGYPEIVTHGHFVLGDAPVTYVQTAPVIKIAGKAKIEDYLLLAGLLNTSGPLFWLKQICFNKGAGEDEHRDRFVFAGNKVAQLPVPATVADALRGKPSALAERLTALSRACWESGRELPSLALRKLFEKSGEAYAAWNAALPGHVAPHAKLAAAFTTTAELQERFARAVSLREQLRAGMVARQEEMDWLVYAAYGLGDLRLTICDLRFSEVELTLDESQRPFRLWTKANGDFNAAIGLIPSHWSHPRRALWEARLAAIRDNEHVRRIEQPVYKRRWDEQWKVGNRWMAGPVAYAQEFVDAFRWWLAEKAEWLLEHKAAGGPVELGGWTPSLWKDKRIEAAWPVVTDAIHQVGQFKFDASENEEKKLNALDASYESFAKFLKDTVIDETVPSGIPPAVSWDDLAAKKKWTTAQLKKAAAVRGKLNVPRERFRLMEDWEFVWAGKDSK
jgi:hypothetical protein